jgi:hypothetical protein
MSIDQVDTAPFDARSFDGGRIPVIGETPIDVAGLDETGLAFVDEEIIYALAREALPGQTPPLEYASPRLSIGQVLRGNAINNKGDLTLRKKSFGHFQGASLEDGSAQIERDAHKIRVGWQADLCFRGVGIVAARTRAVTVYDTRSDPEDDIALEITRNTTARDMTITPTHEFRKWAAANGIRLSPSRKDA